MKAKSQAYRYGIISSIRKKTSIMKQIILASTSPRRKELLRKTGLKFKVVSSDYLEKFNPRLKARSNAEYLSAGKAKAVANIYPDAIIIAADTFVVFQDEFLGKPVDEKSAKRMLRKLSGTRHQVITGFTIIDTTNGKTITKSVVTDVYVKKLSVKEIEGYVASGESLDAAGAYKIQEKGSAFIEKIDGDFFNVVGLPVNALVEELKHFGVYLF
jgi:septum formation protein